MNLQTSNFESVIALSLLGARAGDRRQEEELHFNLCVYMVDRLRQGEVSPLRTSLPPHLTRQVPPLA